MVNDNVGILRKLVEATVAAQPYELDGFQWAVFHQQELAEAAGFSAATIRRLAAKPPFVRQSKQIDGKKCFLLRVGEPGPPTPRHIANTMSKIWREWLHQRMSTIEAERAKLLVMLSAEDTEAEKETILKKITKVEAERKKLWMRTTKDEYGCMIGLAEIWPSGHQVKLFKMAIDNWSFFMVGVKWLATDEEWPDLNMLDRYLKYPSIALIRKAHKVAMEMVLIETQDMKKKAPAWMQSVMSTLQKGG